MAKIICPKCGEEIELGKDAYNELLNEIKTEEIDKQLKQKEEDLKKVYDAKLELAESKAKTTQSELINKLETEKKVLEEKLANNQKDIEVAVNKATAELQASLNKKDNDIVNLNSKLLEEKQKAAEESKKQKENYDFLLKAKEDEIERWKNYRMGDSTKDLGESLEQYCRDAFDEVRAVAYPDAYFEKDNKVDEEGKGDFIFRDYQDSIETVSIMFEMKTEKDTTATKHKNEHFFDKLDKNRTSKNCEYAVLVSTLESDSALYNKGIVDVSHKYPKMFVVRPQFFLTIIGLIRNMAKNSFAYKKQVVEYQRENADITHFEEAVKMVANKISDDYENASKQYDKVEKMCDDMIAKLQNLKETFRLTQGWIGKAQNQLPNLEIRKLTRGNPTMKEKFEELEKKKKGE